MRTEVLLLLTFSVMLPLINGERSMSMTDWPPYFFNDQQKDIIRTSVTTSKKTFKCTFKMVLDGKDVKLKQSTLSCNPKKPKAKNVKNLKICGKFGSYIVSISINPNKILKAKRLPPCKEKQESCDDEYTRVCPPNSSGGCDQGLYKYCPHIENDFKAESQSHNCKCWLDSIVNKAVSSGGSLPGGGKGCMCLSESFGESTTTTTSTPSPLPENPKKFCQMGDSCWPSTDEIETFRGQINGDTFSCLGLKKFVYKEDGYAYNNTPCLNYTGFENKNAAVNCVTATPYEFLTHRRYIVEMLKAAFIVTVENETDIVNAIRFANNHSLGIAVMSTGHDQAERNSGPGFDSLLIRTTCLQHWETQKAENNEFGWSEGYAVVGAGLTFGANYWRDLKGGKGLYDLAKDVDREIVGGDCASVGIAGWTLGGGRGIPSAKHGLGVDQVLQVDLVTGDGELKTADINNNNETFFYAIKGGGGGFGVIYQMKIKLHKRSCIRSTEECYQINHMNMSQKYDSSNYMEIIKYINTTARTYMQWSMIHRKNCSSSFNFYYDHNDTTHTRTYGMNIWATCFVLDSWAELESNITANGNIHWNISSTLKDTFWSEDAKIPVGELYSDIRSLINSSAASNSFMDTLLNHWIPMCDQNPTSPCASGFEFHGNLPALCEDEDSSCNLSIHNSGGPLPQATRTASFLVMVYDMSIKNDTNTKEITNNAKYNAWMHQVMATVLYKYSKTSLYNEPEFTMYPGQWERRFWGEKNHAELLRIKKRVDPHHNLVCNQCVGTEVGKRWGCSLPMRQVDNKCILPEKVDGKWGTWGSWSSCDSKSEKKRIRKCDNPAPLYGGTQCAGDSTEEISCSSCKEGWSGFGSNCYKYFETKLTWQDAENQCKLEGGHLTSVYSKEENDFIKSLTSEWFWIGLTDFIEGVWVWSDGSPFSFNNWSGTGNPDNFEGNEDCVQATQEENGNWNDLNCANPLPFMCKTSIQEGRYVYISEKKIVSLPTFDEIPCEQSFPMSETHTTPGPNAGIYSAGVVTHNGTNTIMFCAGVPTPCRVWTKDGWLEKGPNFGRRHAASSNLSDGRWLVTGGFTHTCTTYSEAAGWQPFPSLPGTRESHCQVTSGTDTYVTGGYNGHRPQHKTLFRISDGDDSWTTLAPMIEGRYSHGCSFFGGKLYVFGGIDEVYRYLASVEIFDPEANSWISGPDLPQPMVDTQAAVHEDVLYLFCGKLAETWQANTAVYKLNEEQKKWEVVAGASLDGCHGPERLQTTFTFTLESQYCQK